MSTVGERPPLAGGYKFAAHRRWARCSRNITPDPEAGIGRYTDGQISANAALFRQARRTRVDQAVDAAMRRHERRGPPTAIVSFLRSRSSLFRNPCPTTRVDDGRQRRSRDLAPTFKPRVWMRRFIPPKRRRRPSRRARAAVLVRSVGDCSGCHSPLDQLTFSLNGPEFSGGVAIRASRASQRRSRRVVQAAQPGTAHGQRADALPGSRKTFVARFRGGGRKYARRRRCRGTATVA